MILKEWIDEIEDDTVIAVGGATSYLFIGKKKYLDAFLKLESMEFLKSHEVIKTYKQNAADYATVAIVQNAGLYKSFWFRSECYEHFIDELLRG